MFYSIDPSVIITHSSNYTILVTPRVILPPSIVHGESLIAAIVGDIKTPTLVREPHDEPPPVVTEFRHGWAGPHGLVELEILLVVREGL